MHPTPANHRMPTPALGTLYTLGYTAEGARQTVDDLLALDVTIVDICLQPSSVRPLWDQAVLSAWLGKYYWHLPTLGNTNYAHRGAPIRWLTRRRDCPNWSRTSRRVSRWHSCASAPRWSAVTAC